VGCHVAADEVSFPLCFRAIGYVPCGVAQPRHRSICRSTVESTCSVVVSNDNVEKAVTVNVSVVGLDRVVQPFDDPFVPGWVFVPVKTTRQHDEDTASCQASQRAM
jgi:hypothetical protein